MARSKSHKAFKIFLGIFLIAACYWVYVSYAIYSYGYVDELTKADAAIVLGAAIYGDEPSPVFEERINHGIWLYKNGYVSKLIFTGGRGASEKHSESSIAKRFAMEHSIPAKDIFIDEKSTITQENIANAARIVEKNHFSKVIIVSDPLHMKRAMLIAKDYGLRAYSSPTPTSRYKTIKSKFVFLEREVFYYIGYKVYNSIK